MKDNMIHEKDAEIKQCLDLLPSKVQRMIVSFINSHSKSSFGVTSVYFSLLIQRLSISISFKIPQIVSVDTLTFQKLSHHPRLGTTMVLLSLCELSKKGDRISTTTSQTAIGPVITSVLTDIPVTKDNDGKCDDVDVTKVYIGNCGGDVSGAGSSGGGDVSPSKDCIDDKTPPVGAINDSNEGLLPRESAEGKKQVEGNESPPRRESAKGKTQVEGNESPSPRESTKGKKAHVEGNESPPRESTKGKTQVEGNESPTRRESAKGKTQVEGNESPPRRESAKGKTQVEGNESPPRRESVKDKTHVEGNESPPTESTKGKAHVEGNASPPRRESAKDKAQVEGKESPPREHVQDNSSVLIHCKKTTIGIVVERAVLTSTYGVTLLQPVLVTLDNDSGASDRGVANSGGGASDGGGTNDSSTSSIRCISDITLSEMYEVPTSMISSLNLDHFHSTLMKIGRNYITTSSPTNQTSEIEEELDNACRVEELPMRLLLRCLQKRPNLKILSLVQLNRYLIHDDQLLALCGYAEACRKYQFHEPLENKYLQQVDCRGSKFSREALMKVSALLAKRSDGDGSSGHERFGYSNGSSSNNSGGNGGDSGSSKIQSVYDFKRHVLHQRCWKAAHPDSCWSARDVVEMQLRCFQEGSRLNSHQGMIIAHRFDSVKNKMHISSTEQFVHLMETSNSVMLNCDAYEAYHVISFDMNNSEYLQEEEEDLTKEEREDTTSSHTVCKEKALFLVRVCKLEKVEYFIWDLERDRTSNSRYFGCWFTNSVSAYELLPEALYEGNKETSETVPFIVSMLQRMFIVDEAEY